MKIRVYNEINRASADIHNSLEMLRAYRSRFFRKIPLLEEEN